MSKPVPWPPLRRAIRVAHLRDKRSHTPARRAPRRITAFRLGMTREVSQARTSSHRGAGYRSDGADDVLRRDPDADIESRSSAAWPPASLLGARAGRERYDQIKACRPSRGRQPGRTAGRRRGSGPGCGAGQDGKAEGYRRHSGPGAEAGEHGKGQGRRPWPCASATATRGRTATRTHRATAIWPPPTGPASPAEPWRRATAPPTRLTADPGPAGKSQRAAGAANA